MDVLYHLKLPIDDVEKRFMARLEWNDLLRLRRVSKSYKRIVEGYIEKYPNLAPEIEISSRMNSLKNLEAFVHMGISTEKLFLNNEINLDFCKSNDGFASKFAPKVKHLRIHQFPVYLTRNQKEFFKAFSNLRSFSVEQYVPRLAVGVEASIPSQLKELRALKINFVPLVHESSFLETFDKCLSACSFLECIGLPGVSGEAGAKILNIVTSYIQQRAIEESNLKLVEFEKFLIGIITTESSLALQRALTRFLEVCADKNIKISNILIDMLHKLSLQQFVVPANLISAYILSLPYSDWMLNLPSLEKLQIGSVAWREENVFRRPNWPKLASLQIELSKDGLDSEIRQSVRFLFEGLSYTYLTELFISFEREFGFNVTNTVANNVTNSCINLKKLTLDKCFGCSRGVENSWNKVWKGLPQLKEVTLKNCNLNDKCFIGSDPRNPTFVNLKNLTKLFIDDALPISEFGISDNFLTSVVSKMRLTHFVVSLHQYYQRDLITSSGIDSLLNGVFAETIQKFPIEGWFEEDEVPERVQQLHQLFRVTRML